MRSFQIRQPRELGPFLRHLAKSGGNYHAAAELAFRTGEVGTSLLLQKAAAASSAGTTWGDEAAGLVNLHNELVESVNHRSVIGALDCRRTPLRTRILSAATGSTAAWVGQGDAVPVSELSLVDDVLHPLNLTTMVLITKELLNSGGSRLEQWLVRETVTSISGALDNAFCDPGNSGVSAIKPASVTAGAVSVSATGGLGSDAAVAALKGDLRKLFARFTGNWDSAVLVIPTRLAAAAQLAGIPLLSPTSENTVPVFCSGSYPTDGASPDAESLFLIDTSALVSGDLEIVLDASDQGDLILGAGPMNTTSPAAKSVTSLWQAGAVALRAQIATNWSVPPAGRVVVLTDIPRS